MSPHLQRIPILRRLGQLAIFPLTVVTAVADPTDVSADLARFTQNGKIPGLVAAAVLDGEIVAAGATGVRKQGDPTPVTIHDKFHIGSCTKSMTATLAAILVADGKIKWSSTVAEVFPDWGIHPDFQKTTLLQLCSNSGGLAHDVPPALWKTTVDDREKPEAEQRRKFIQALLLEPPAYPPGTQNVYSNSGFTIAGAMLEKVSGKPYDELIKERLFTPLHLDSAGFGPAATAGNIDQPYGHVRRLGFTFNIPPGPDADNPPAITPAGRVHLSIMDLATYASFHLGTAKNPPLDSEALKFLHTPVAPSKEYACGWINLERPWAGGTALMHNGTNTTNYAVMWLAPNKKFAAVAACNIDSEIGPKACDDAVTFLIEKYLEKRQKP
ncbi:MAG: serine hydrolase domain-containing protein [Luteolibacter sp.]